MIISLVAPGTEPTRTPAVATCDNDRLTVRAVRLLTVVTFACYRGKAPRARQAEGIPLAAQSYQPSTRPVQPNWHSTPAWRTSSFSAGAGECVEVATAAPFVLARDSRDRSGPVLELTSAQWVGLVKRIKNGNAVVG
jgi:hypothetical protein